MDTTAELALARVRYQLWRHYLDAVETADGTPDSILALDRWARLLFLADTGQHPELDFGRFGEYDEVLREQADEQLQAQADERADHMEDWDPYEH